MGKGFDNKLFNKLLGHERAIDECFRRFDNHNGRIFKVEKRTSCMLDGMVKMAKKQKSLVKDVNRLYLLMSGAMLVGVYAYKEQSRINAKLNRKIEELKRDVNALYAAQPDVGSCYPEVEMIGDIQKEDGLSIRKDSSDGSKDDPFSRILNGEFGENSAQK